MRFLLFFLIVLSFLIVMQKKEESPAKNEEYEYELCGVWVDTKIPDGMSPEMYVSQDEDESIFPKEIQIRDDAAKEGLFFK